MQRLNPGEQKFSSYKNSVTIDLMLESIRMQTDLKPGKDYIGVGIFALIQNNQKKILLTKCISSEKKGVDCEGIWSMLGGTLEFGEACLNCLQREIKEELGIRISNIQFLNYNDYIQKNKHWLALNFSAYTSDIPKNREIDKYEAVQWFDLAAPPKNISPYTKKCLDDLIVNS